MEDIEKSGDSVVSPARVVIADDPDRGRGHSRSSTRDRSRSHFSHRSADDITPIANSATVPIQYRTL